MSTILFKNIHLARQILISALILAIILPFLPLTPIFSLFLIILVFIFIIALNYPLTGLFLLLIIRPILDYFTHEPLFDLLGKPINLASLFGALVIAFCILQITKSKTKIKHSPLVWAWLIFLVITGVSAVLSPHHFTGLTEWLRLLSIFSLFLLGLILITSREDLSQLIKIIILSTLIPAIFAFWQFFTKTGISLPMEGIYNRIYGTFAHPNLLAYYLLIPIILSFLIFLFGKKTQIPKILYLFASIILCVLMALTFTRGAWAAFILVIFLLGAFRYRAFATIILLLAALTYFIIPPINSRINDLIHPNEYSSINWRINLWQDSLGLIKKQPLLGYGTGSASQVILASRGEEAGSPDPHNDYIKISLENGLVGLFSYVLLILALGYELIKKSLAEKLPKLKVFVLAIIAISLTLFTLSLVDNILRNTALEWSFWVLAGGLLAVTPSTLWQRMLNR